MDTPGHDETPPSREGAPRRAIPAPPFPLGRQARGPQDQPRAEGPGNAGEPGDAGEPLRDRGPEGGSEPFPPLAGDGPAAGEPVQAPDPDPKATSDLPVLTGGNGRGRRRVRTVLAGVCVLLLVMMGSAGALLLYGRGSIDRAEVLGMAAVDRVPLTLPDGEDIEIMNVLLIGSDDRDNLSAEAREQITLEDRSVGRRPDTIMLAQLELGGKGAALLSFPRDLRVELCDGSKDKINAAFLAAPKAGKNPESCLVDTVTRHTGIEVHHYAEVDFAGFLEVVGILGGVTMHLDAPMVDSKASLDVPAGCVTLTPEQALGFVRSRGYDDDFGRMARQQRFVREVLEELTRVGVIANPSKLVSLVDAGANAVTTDRDFGLGVMRDVASGARRMTAERLVTETVPGDNKRIGGLAYVVEREDEAAPLYASFVDGTVLRPQPEPEPEALVVPPVVVLNSTGVDGLAAVAAEVLEVEGYEVAEVGNAEVDDLPVTEIVHAPELAEAAEAVAAAVPGSVVRADDGVEGIQVVLGADAELDQLEALLADEPPAASPTPSPTPAAEPTFRGADPGDVDC